MPDSTQVLVIAPHPDDEAIGCGGALCLHAARGHRVTVVFLTSGELGLKHLPREQAWAIREQEAKAAAAILGVAALHFLRAPDWFVGDNVSEIAAKVGVILQTERPGLIYVPHPAEWHPDHKTAIAVLRSALEGASSATADVRAFEVWTPLSAFDHVEDITPVMARKLAAVRCYRSQLSGFRYDRAVRGLNQYRGVMAARSRYAEVFVQLGGSMKSGGAE
jgi:LmbE family N-acetylglucosaminyl deacetylase